MSEYTNEKNPNVERANADFEGEINNGNQEISVDNRPSSIIQNKLQASADRFSNAHFMHLDNIVQKKNSLTSGIEHISKLDLSALRKRYSPIQAKKLRINSQPEGVIQLRQPNPNRLIHKDEFNLQNDNVELTQHHIVAHSKIKDFVDILETDTAKNGKKDQLKRKLGMLPPSETEFTPRNAIALNILDLSKSKLIIDIEHLDTPMKNLKPNKKGKPLEEWTNLQQAYVRLLNNSSQSKKNRSESEEEFENKKTIDIGYAFLEWLPGNMLEGPLAKSRANDGGSKIDEEALAVVSKINPDQAKDLLALNDAIEKENHEVFFEKIQTLSKYKYLRYNETAHFWSKTEKHGKAVLKSNAKKFNKEEIKMDETTKLKSDLAKKKAVYVLWEPHKFILHENWETRQGAKDSAKGQEENIETLRLNLILEIGKVTALAKFEDKSKKKGQYKITLKVLINTYLDSLKAIGIKGLEPSDLFDNTEADMFSIK